MATSMSGTAANIKALTEKVRDLVSRWISSWPTQFRLMLLSAAVGIVAGLGAILFDKVLGLSLDWFLKGFTGYSEPAAGASAASLPSLESGRSLWFFLIPALGGLLSGVIVFGLAPEAEGHGTDAMIEAFHKKGGKIRKRVPIVKIVASALTIGSGGSAGKEGPIAQIGSGFGSAFAALLKLKPRERRILVLAGAAGGIGAIFQAPLGAALFAPEVLYRETEFEYDAILPCIVSSILAYAVYSQLYKGGALFFPGPVGFAIPKELLPYALFGIVCSIAGFLYIRTFYGSRDRFFRPLRIHRMLKPAVGGLMLGAIAYFFPQISDGGYGWVQMAMEGKLLWWLMLLLAVLKIAATSCTISSGGSGGVFGPSVFIGAMLGGAFGFLGHQVAPGWVVHPNAFVLVGIGGFFAGVAKVPIASIIMACEMSASYTLLVPLMLVSSISFLLLRNVSLYEKQQISRFASPAHLTEFARGMLERIRVRDAVHARPITVLPETLPFGELVKTVTRSGESHFPVVDRSGKMTGILSINDVRSVLFEDTVDRLIVARDVATPNVVRVFWNDTLQEALEKMAAINVDELPVASEERPDEIVAMISKREIVDYYYGRSTS
ncbi:MAG: Cl-channel voltage-gated family protein [Deltaproteobacteria bacterium]|nr:Cl-channel voltage-gated family protein [Deltaproteobacteria bacterium]